MTLIFIPVRHWQRYHASRIRLPDAGVACIDSVRLLANIELILTRFVTNYNKVRAKKF